MRENQQKTTHTRDSYNPELVKTLNCMGYSSPVFNAYTQAFLDYVAKGASPILDIGSAFGFLSLEALQLGAEVVANDIERQHLQILYGNAPEKMRSRLHLKEGRFPDELTFSENTFEAIIASQIFHFLPTMDIIKGLKLCLEWLKPGGKLFVTCTSPHDSLLHSFLPVFEQRKRDGETWPGAVDDLSLYCNNEEILTQNPASMTFFDEDTLKDVVVQVGFQVDKVGFFTRETLPPFQLKDRRNDVGLIGTKPL